MRYVCLFACLAALVSGCASTNKPAGDVSAPETVLITYHVKPGKEAALAGKLKDLWDIYLSKRLVYSKPHVVVQTTVDGQPCLIEVLTWVNHTAPDNAPDSVKTLWGDLNALCEPRNGRPGVDGGEVQLVAPRAVSLFQAD